MTVTFETRPYQLKVGPVTSLCWADIRYITTIEIETSGASGANRYDKDVCIAASAEILKKFIE